MRVGDRVRIDRGAWLYGEFGVDATLYLVGVVSRGPETRSWGLGVNVRLSAEDLDRRMGGRWSWANLASDGTVEMTFNAAGVAVISELTPTTQRSTVIARE